MKTTPNFLLVVAAVAAIILTNCAAPDPFLAHVQQRSAQIEDRKAQIVQMPESTPDQINAKSEAIDQVNADIRELRAEVDRERRTRAMELSAISQAEAARPQPTP